MGTIRVHRFARRPAHRVAILVLLAALAAGCARPDPGPAAPAVSFEDAFGIRVDSVRLAAGNGLVDVRYTVLDPVRSAAFQSRAVSPHLVSEKTGTRLSVPVTSKAGALRQAPRVAEAGRTYFILFRNVGESIRPGDRVDLVSGGMRSGGYVVM